MKKVSIMFFLVLLAFAATTVCGQEERYQPLLYKVSGYHGDTVIIRYNKPIFEEIEPQIFQGTELRKLTAEVGNVRGVFRVSFSPDHDELLVERINRSVSWKRLIPKIDSAVRHWDAILTLHGSGQRRP